jgi:hypothetical protein
MLSLFNAVADGDLEVEFQCLALNIVGLLSRTLCFHRLSVFLPDTTGI